METALSPESITKCIRDKYGEGKVTQEQAIACLSELGFVEAGSALECELYKRAVIRKRKEEPDRLMVEGITKEDLKKDSLKNLPGTRLVHPGGIEVDIYETRGCDSDDKFAVLMIHAPCYIEEACLREKAA